MPVVNTNRNRERRIAAQALFQTRKRVERARYPKQTARQMRRGNMLPKALTDEHAARYAREILGVRIENIIDYQEPDDLHLNYREFERDVLTPQLKAKGYDIVRWHDGERDSFGPLARVAVAYSPTGVRCDLVYG